METNAYRGRLNGPHETAPPGPAVSVSSSLALSRMAPSSAALATLLAIFSLTLAACGGGGGGGGGPTLATPKSNQTNAYGDVQRTRLAGSSQVRSYAIAATGAAIAHRANQKGKGVTVAVVDTGVDVNHPDLEEAFDWSGASDRRTQNPKGRNFVASPDYLVKRDNVRPRAPNLGPASWIIVNPKGMSHGTHVAGIIAARDDNNEGVVGVAPEANLLPIRWLKDGRSEKYFFASDADPGEPGLENYGNEYARVIDFASRNGTFVLNNSWGTNWRPRVVEVSLPNNKKGYILQPRVVKKGYKNFTSKMVSDVLAKAVSDAEARSPDGIMFVFAAGNDGWNSETGEVEVFSQKFEGEDIHRYLNDDQRKDPLFLPADAPQIARTGTPANLPGPLSAAFIGNRQLQGIWLSVVATDRNNRITPFSNGCGEAATYCLAAPGAWVLSTVYSEDGEFSSFINKTAYASFQGTSMAAPMVSGAAAVVKGAYPNLTARQVVDILLRSATDLGAPGTDPVYGHGLLNLARALQPIGPTRAAAAGAFGVAAAADTRVAFSSAFGNAAPSQELDFGGLDMFGRVYRFRAPLQDRVMPGPRLAGVMAMTAPPPPVVMGRGDGVTTLLRRSTNVDSAIGDGGVISYLGARSRTDLALVNRRTGAALSPAALLRQGDDVAPVWESLAPQARDIIGTSSDWQMAPNLHAGVFFSRATVAAATRRGESYSVRDYGVSSRIGSRAGGVEARLGRMNENGRFLGSRPEGGYALARPTRSDYLRLRASHRLAPGLSVGAEWLRLRARVDFRHDGFVRDMALDARAAGVHLAADDLARDGDRLVLHYGEPLAVTGGVMRQTSVTGYTSSGAYRATTRDLDLAVRKRHRMAQMIYQRPLGGRVSGFAAAAHHRNWSHQGGLTNNLVMLGLSLTH